MDPYLTTGIATLVLLLFLAGLLASWRRVMAQDSRLRIWEALRQRGLGAEDAVGQERALAVAVRNCALCPSTERCDKVLAAGPRNALDAFCPNAGFFERLGPKR
jgi:hypothetical protein